VRSIEKRLFLAFIRLDFDSRSHGCDERTPVSATFALVFPAVALFIGRQAPMPPASDVLANNRSATQMTGLTGAEAVGRRRFGLAISLLLSRRPQAPSLISSHSSPTAGGSPQTAARLLTTAGLALIAAGCSRVICSTVSSPLCHSSVLSGSPDWNCGDTDTVGGISP
jgi:hypothetical protein